MLSPYPPTGPYVRPSAISSHQQQSSSFEQQPQCSSALNPNSISLFVELQTLIIMFSNSNLMIWFPPFFLKFLFSFWTESEESLISWFFPYFLK